MPIYFAFSDECGAYQRYPNKKQLTSHPFYIRATLLMNADEWKTLNLNFNNLKETFSIPLHKEVKWAYLWSLTKYKRQNKYIPDWEPFYFLRDYEVSDIISFIDESLALMNDLVYKKIIITFTDNFHYHSADEKHILSWHIQELMQRIEMELEDNNHSNLAVLFFDPVSENKNKLFREIYFDIYRSGDFIEKYSHIKDSLNIEFSHQSCGIQIADYIAGAFSSVIKANHINNYKDGVEMFYKYIHPYLRRGYNGLWGFGLREVPRDTFVRRKYAHKLYDLRIEFESNSIL